MLQCSSSSAGLSGSIKAWEQQKRLFHPSGKGRRWSRSNKPSCISTAREGGKCWKDSGSGECCMASSWTEANRSGAAGSEEQRELLMWGMGEEQEKLVTEAMHSAPAETILMRDSSMPRMARVNSVSFFSLWSLISSIENPGRKPAQEVSEKY